MIECIENNDEYRNWSEVTNAPFGKLQNLEGQPTALVAFWIYRGYRAVPDMKPYLLVFRSGPSGWQETQSVETGLSGHSFFIHQLDSDSSHINVLVYGNRIGDTGSRLTATVISLEGGEVTDLVEVSGNHVAVKTRAAR